MAKSNGNKYQYDTSPRKLEPDYTRPKQNNKTAKKPQIKSNNRKKSVLKELEETKLHRRTVLYIILGFVIVFGISYRNSEIDENFMRIQNMKTELAAIQKDNSQMQVAVESSLKLKEVEKQAKGLLGMQKLKPEQTKYVSLPKTEYIEPTVEKVVIKEESVVQRIINTVMNIFK